jgi:Cu(I)/Ag(I) efflux system membrane fusion protein
MRRTLQTFLAVMVVVVLLVAAVAAYVAAYGVGAGRAPTAVSGTGPQTSRGEVTIDPRRQQLMGVRTVTVTRAAVEATVRTVGLVRYNETALTDVNVKVEGWIRDLYVDATGQAVRAGEPLFTLYSPDVLATQHEYLLALTTRDRLQQSVMPDARERADALVTSARQRLALWDLPPEELRALDTKRQATEALVFRSPATGVVIDKQALKGLHVMPGQTLYKLADLSRVWIEADIYENELAGVRLGEPATVTLDAYPGERFSGRVAYIYPYLDEKSRTNKVRLELANHGGRLKPGMFAHVELRTRGGTGLMVPTNAVLDDGTEQVAFVARGEGVFEPRTVKVGRRVADAIEILEGLRDGEQVATGAAFFLDSESQLRASLHAYETPPVSAGSAGAPAAAHLDLTLRTRPDPPRAGDNEFEVLVKDASGTAIDDAEVTVQLFMPAMPTMNMPAMRSETKLSPAGGGLYRGSGQILMAGRWDAIVMVTRRGAPVAQQKITLTTK